MKLTIGHLDYEVRPMTEDDESHGVNNGETDLETQEILIDCSTSAARQMEVLLHEIVHALWNAYDMPARAGEERVCGFLGNGLTAVMRANPHLLPVLIAMRDGAGFVEE